MPDSVLANIEHDAPMLISWGRGNGVGLFSVRQSTPVEIPGVPPADLARAKNPPPGMPDEVLACGGRLWAPVLGRHPVSGTLTHPDLKVALYLLDGGRVEEGTVLELPHLPPLRNPFGDDLHVARSMQSRGKVPVSAEGHVKAARALSSRAIAAHASSNLLHDGHRLFARLPIPRISGSHPGSLSFGLHVGLQKPDFLHTRLGPGGLLPYGGTERVPMLVQKAEALSRFLADMGVEAGDGDIDAFVASAPAALAKAIREGKDPSMEPHLARLWPLILSGARGEEPDCGREAAAETVREVAQAMIALPGRPQANGTAAAGRSLYHATALEACVEFVERIVRPSMSRPVSPEDEAALSLMTP